MMRDSKGRFCKAVVNKEEEKVYETGVKGFLPGMICSPDGFHKKQYKENSVFEEAGRTICNEGVMHAATNASTVLEHFNLLDDNANFNEFAPVKALAPVQREDTKWATTKLFVGKKYTFGEFVEEVVKNASQLASSGDFSQLASSGDFSQLASSGDFSQLASSGNYSQLASSGNWFKLASSGKYSQLASSSYGSQLASSGDFSQLASSGHCSKLANSGNGSKLASSGYRSQLASSGHCSQLASSGNGAKLASSGNGDTINSTGEKSVIAAIGNGSKAKGKKGSWLFLAEYNKDGVIIFGKAVEIDGVVVKEDTFYTLKNKVLVEVR